MLRLYGGTGNNKKNIPQATRPEYAKPNPKNLISQFTSRIDSFSFAKSHYTAILQ